MLTAMQICNHPFYIAILEHIAFLISFELKELHQFKCFYGYHTFSRVKSGHVKTQSNMELVCL